MCWNAKSYQLHRKLHKDGLIPSTENKLYSCKGCRINYKSLKELVAHMKAQHDQQEFSCALCPRSYKFPISLARHIRIHNSSKPSCCQKCGKKYKNQNSLRKHENQHRSETEVIDHAVHSLQKLANLVNFS